MTTIPTSSDVSRHKCLIYEGHPSEQLPVIVPLLVDSLNERRRCLYLGDPETIGMVRSALAGRGIDVEREAERGALVFSSDRSHLDGGGFDPEAMVAMLCRLIDDALRDGFTGLCATGDMRWELGSDANFERLREYEARLELVFRDKPLSGICQYHRDTVPASAIRHALTAHRAAYLGRALNEDNLFYIPPELLLKDGADRGDQLADWMWSQLSRLMRAEEQRDRSLRELADLNRELERRVRERTADLESFSRSVSHDLRAPLRSIDGYARILLAEHSARLDADGQACLSRVVDAGRRMSRLIDALLELFTLTNSALRVDLVDLSGLAEDLVAELRAGDPSRRASVRVQPGLAARGDSRLLSAALANLLGNAWKFTAKSPDARVEFGARVQDGGRVFYVSDNGAGFDTTRHDRLFKPFSRLHTADEFPGHGLGLATVRRVLFRHGGAIWAESSPGHGATFFFTLPETSRADA
jgi:signal transduction histidine kinase